ncbi:hypothetical protein KDA_76280 [Dictyobacter alpinus]|uniref:SMP domain-containing protein n=1 Tax=Dictyobacter alpinus TaxID=2014873 RepID=A0A402BLC0_9CHLR|nr:hypothetical protein [Dictyobacter alpinus]GCE32144.1 hypothetical protein KDA_76280 [Dictyobacter alpinus]
MAKGSGGSGKGGSNGGKGSGSGKSGGSSMSKEDASRIQSAADRHPDSDTAKSGFDERAQSAADRAENEQHSQADK